MKDKVDIPNQYEIERQNSKGVVSIVINTRVPSKWRLVDLETGDIWKWGGKSSKYVRMG